MLKPKNNFQNRETFRRKTSDVKLFGIGTRVGLVMRLIIIVLLGRGFVFVPREQSFRIKFVCVHRCVRKTSIVSLGYLISAARPSARTVPWMNRSTVRTDYQTWP